MSTVGLSFVGRFVLFRSVLYKRISLYTQILHITGADPGGVDWVSSHPVWVLIVNRNN